MEQTIIESESGDIEPISKTIVLEINNQDVTISFTIDLTEEKNQRVQRIFLETIPDYALHREGSDKGGSRHG